MSKLRFLFVPILIFFSYLEAHELNPARLILEEVEPYSFDVVWKFPSNVLTQPGSIVFPSICKETSKSLPEVERKYLITYSSLVCESSLQGNDLSVKGLSRMTDALISIRFSDGNKYEGLVSVSIEKNPEMNTSEFEDWLESLASSTIFKSGATESCSIWKPVPGQDEMTGKAPMDLGTSPGGENRYMQLFFMGNDPREVWDSFIEYGKAVDSSDVGKIFFAAPFFPTVV